MGVGAGVAVGTGVALGAGVGVVVLGMGVGDGCLLRVGSELAVELEVGSADAPTAGDALAFGTGFRPKPDGPEIPDPPPAHAVRKSATLASAENIRIAIVLGSAGERVCPLPRAELRRPTHDKRRC